jgi:uncharacterized membrane protein
MGLALRFLDLKPEKTGSEILHSVAVLNAVLLFGWIVSTGASDLAVERDWYPIMWGLTGVVTLFTLNFYRNVKTWPVQTFESVYKEFIPGLVVVFTTLWILTSSWQLIQPHDWNYIPFFNPLELVHIAGFWMLSVWALKTDGLEPVKRRFFQYVFPLLIFIWMNSLVGKGVHYWAGVRFDPETLLAYPMFQAATSVLWSGLALIFVTLARKRSSRELWLIGIILLGAVVLKLLFFDLVDSGTLGRIISFLAVGVLMLVIGYIAPMPPKPDANTS